MSKPIKLGLIFVGGFVALFVLAAVILVATVDPNEYKGEIAQAVKDSTGRDLTFEGDIGFNFFPWLGLKVGPVALGNAAGFSPSEMVRINKAEANIQIMPLLTGNIAIGTVVLDGFTLNLAVNKAGVSNWDDLAKGPTEQDKPAAQEKKSTETGGGGPKISSLTVQGVEITNANVEYNDMKAGKKSSLTDLNLVIGEVGDKLPTPFELTFQLKVDDPKIDTRPKLVGVATFDTDAGTLQIVDLAFEALGLNVTGDFFLKSKDGLNYSGELKLAEFSPKMIMEQLNMEPIITADIAALTKVSADLKVNGTDSKASLEQLVIKLDDTTITTEGSVTNFAKPAIVVKTNVDDIDVDRYMPPPSESKGEAKPAEPVAESEAPAEEPDLSALKGLDLDTKLTVGKVKAMNLRITDILCQTRVKDGILTIKPFSAKLYDGSLTAHSALDANQTPARWKEAADLKGVQAGPLLKDLTGKDHLLGTTVAKYNLMGFGLTPDNIKKSITGTASFAFTDGAVNGVNVAKMLRDAFNTIKGKPATTDEPARTDFAELLGSAVIKKGHITNNDLLMKSPLLRVTGKGWANLPKNSVDYLATVTVVGTLKGQEGESMEDLKGLPLPIYAKGTLDNPSIGLDGKAMAEALLKGTFKKGTKDLEKNLKESILGGSKSGDEEKSPGSILKGLF